MKNKMPETLEVGMLMKTKDGIIMKITSDDMPGFPYECFERKANKAEIKEYKDFYEKKAYTMKQLKDAIEYACGCMCGKHNLHIDPEERNEFFDEFLNEIIN